MYTILSKLFSIVIVKNDLLRIHNLAFMRLLSRTFLTNVILRYNLKKIIKIMVKQKQQPEMNRSDKN